jgi:arylsulfatase A-like enzyme
VRARTLLVTVAVLAACHGEPIREQVVLRLDGRDFGNAGSTHVPGVEIGDVVLPVPYSRDVHLSPVVETSPARGGRVHATVSVPKAFAGWPRSAFALAVKVDLGAAAAVLDRNAAATFGLTAIRLPKRWRLRFDPRAPERRKLTAELQTAHDGRTSLVQLEATTPMPRHLTSRRFDVASGSTLTLRYGLADRTQANSSKPVCFRATLDCTWWWQRELVSDCLVVGDPDRGRWHEAETPLRWGMRDCTLALVTDGGEAGDPVWAVPVVRAPTVDDPVTHPNVVLISLDTLRADHLSGYGYPRATSPSLDELVIRTGTAFTNAVSTYPMTHIAHLSIFTGLFAAALPANGVLPAGAPVPMLTELLRDAGFTTIGVTEDALVAKEYGFGRGFDHLVELHPEWADRARLVFARGGEFLRELRHRRFFLFLHTYKVHSPYLPSPAYTTLLRTGGDEGATVPDVPPQFRNDRDAYDQSIRELDDEVGAFLRTLDTEGVADRTLVIVLSDHGESFGEHGLPGHGLSANQEALHVALVLRGPGIVRGRVETPVSLADVAPTILEVLGLAVPSSMQGRSLQTALAGRSLPPRPVFFEWNAAHARGVRLGDAKLVRSGDSALLYNLGEDPSEVRPVNVREGLPPLLARVLDNYERDGARRRASVDVPSDAPSISPDVGKSLRALGYIE